MLKENEQKSIFIIREAFKKFKQPVILWSCGKDSTLLLYLCKKAFYGKIPFPIIHIDTGFKFPEIYEFRDKLEKKLGLNLIIVKNKDAEGIIPENGKFECCNARKTEALKQAIKKYKIDALILGIRRDEHGIRNKERFFSPRDKDGKWNVFKEKTQAENREQKTESRNEGDSPFIAQQDTEFSNWNIFATDFKDAEHVRIHPILHWTEQEIWQYIKKEKIPVTSLYKAKNNKRYRSIGCKCCCSPISSNANTIDKIIKELKTTKQGEREGRAQDKETEIMQKLRALGYM